MMSIQHSRSRRDETRQPITFSFPFCTSPIHGILCRLVFPSPAGMISSLSVVDLRTERGAHLCIQRYAKSLSTVSYLRTDNVCADYAHICDLILCLELSSHFFSFEHRGSAIFKRELEFIVTSIGTFMVEKHLWYLLARVGDSGPVPQASAQP
jgi:hypothetical protein